MDISESNSACFSSRGGNARAGRGRSFQLRPPVLHVRATPQCRYENVCLFSLVLEHGFLRGEIRGPCFTLRNQLAHFCVSLPLSLPLLPLFFRGLRAFRQRKVALVDLALDVHRLFGHEIDRGNRFDDSLLCFVSVFFRLFQVFRYILSRLRSNFVLLACR